MITKKQKLCYLCGKPNPDTKEHIPPRGIFPKKPTGQLITVPAHETCNGKFKKDDELFRNFIITASYRTPEGRKAWDQQVVPSWKKNPGAKNELKKRLSSILIEDPISGIKIKKTAIMAEASLFHRQIDRFTRGLYYHRFHEPMPVNIEVKISKQQPPEISIPLFNEMFANRGVIMNFHHVEPCIFSYFYGVVKEDIKKGIAIFVFFNTEVFMATTI
jgi:hypothetical protein